MKRRGLVVITFLLVSLSIMAQPAYMSLPLDSSTTTNRLQPIVFTFSTPSSVDPSTIVLFVNGTPYTVFDPELTWSPANLYFTPSDSFDEGEVVCSLAVVLDFSGDTLPGLPVVGRFFVDLSGPFIWASGLVGDTLPTPHTTTSSTLGGWWIVVDRYSDLDPLSLQIRVHGVTYTFPSSAITLTDTTVTEMVVDPITGDTTYIDYNGFLVVFNPVAAGVSWASMDTVVYQFLQIHDAPDYGPYNEFEDSPLSTFYFWVDYLGPRAERVSPIATRVTPVPITSCGDQSFTFRIFDENGVDVSSVVFCARGETLDYTATTFVTVDTLAIDTVFRIFVPDTVYRVYEISPTYNWRSRCTEIEHYVVGGDTIYLVEVHTRIPTIYIYETEDFLGFDDAYDHAVADLATGRTILFARIVPDWNEYLDINETIACTEGENIYYVDLIDLPEGNWFFDTTVIGRANAITVADMYYPDYGWGIPPDFGRIAHPFFMYVVNLIPKLVSFTYTPHPQLAEGETIHVELLEGEDMYGNPLEAHTVAWTVATDRSAPILVDYSPDHGAVLTDLHAPISVVLDDIYGIIDPRTIKMHIHSTSGFDLMIDSLPILEYWPSWYKWDPVTKTFTFYPESMGVSWEQGDTIMVEFIDVHDVVDFCSPNVYAYEYPYIPWTFYIVEGPYLTEYSPDDHSFINCVRPIEFTLYDPDGIDQWTVFVSVEGVQYSLLSAETTIVCHSVDTGGGSVVVSCDTTIYNPLRYLGAGHFRLTIPSEWFTDGREINCVIDSARDLLGHPMWFVGSYGWSFTVDMSGPVYFNPQPTPGSWVGGGHVVASIDVADSISGKIKEDMLMLEFNGDVYGPTLTPSVCTFDGSTVTLDLSATGYTFHHGELVEVCLTSLYDDVDYYCGPTPNPADGLPYCWSFRVDTQAPRFSLVTPFDGAITNCPTQPIKILISDDLGVDPSSIFFIVNSRLYTIASPYLNIVGDTLIFTPPTPWTDGEVVDWALAQIGDIAGNVIGGNPLYGSFTVDLAPPTVTSTTPNDGDVIYRRLEHIFIQLSDFSGVDPHTTDLTVTVTSPDTVIVYHFTDTDGVLGFSVLHGGLIIDLPIDLAGIYLPARGADVDVELRIADMPELDCDPTDGVTGNELYYTFSFSITPGWRLVLQLVPEHMIIDSVTGDTTYVPGDTGILVLGAGYGATAGYDPGIDELAPPAPPPGPTALIPPAFIEDTFRLITDIKSLTDENPRWIIWTGNCRGTVYWDTSAMPDYGMFILNDRTDMRGTDHYSFDVGEALFINFSPNFMHLHKGWNLVSVPVEPDNPLPSAVFPMVDPRNIYVYNPWSLSYENPAEIHAKYAYFVLYVPAPGDPDDIYFSVPGTPIFEYTISNMPNGWNTIGSVFDFTGVDVTSTHVTTIPTGVIWGGGVYWYNPATMSYEFTRYIDVGKGYWVYIDLPYSYTSATMHVEASWLKEATDYVDVLDAEDVANLKIGDSRLTIAVKSDASAGLDEEYDRMLPPAPAGKVHTAYLAEGGVALYRDVKPYPSFTLVVNKPARLVTDRPIVLDGQYVERSIDVEPGAYKLDLVPKSKKPTKLALYPNMPNPFNAATKIAFDLPKEADVKVEVYNMIGQKVKTLVAKHLDAGHYTVVWDGTDDDGNDVVSGVYFYRLSAYGKVQTRKMMLVR